MKQIIVLRHAEKQGDDITKRGVQQAQHLAQKVPKIDVVVSSERMRTQKTAHIVGGKKPHIDGRANPPKFPDSELEHLRERQKEHALGIIGVIWENEAFVQLAHEAGGELQQLVSDLFKKLNKGERALIVTHDGSMVALEKLLKNEDFPAPPTHTYSELHGFVIHEDFRVESFTP